MEYEWEQEEYRKRPHCTVPREWLKLALKTLATHLGQVEDTEPVRVQFDGKMLSFTVAGNLVVLAAQGESWTSDFIVTAGNLKVLPKRLMNKFVDVSVWRSRLQIDRCRYDGVVQTA